MYSEFVEFVRETYQTDKFIPLHEPKFLGNEKIYLNKCIDSTFVSSIGEYVDEFERVVAQYTGAKYAVATANGTAALHVALMLGGVVANDEVLTQSLSFVATCNAISYCNARPVFIDVDIDTCGMSAKSLEDFLQEHSEMRDDGLCWNKLSNRPIRACVPMHTFGHPVKIDAIKAICKSYNISLIEDAAESLGSFYKGKHTGTFGQIGVLSFNGNKIITTGGGGMIITDDKKIAKKAKHITTTAKISHPWKFRHDQVAFNYRLPNINAALGVAQMEFINEFVTNKRQLAKSYQGWGATNGVRFLNEPKSCKSNYWLNAILTDNKKKRDAILKYINDNGVMTRPVWIPMHELEIYKKYYAYELPNTKKLADTIVNIPSSVTI